MAGGSLSSTPSNARPYVLLWIYILVVHRPLVSVLIYPRGY